MPLFQIHLGNTGRGLHRLWPQRSPVMNGSPPEALLMLHFCCRPGILRIGGSIHELEWILWSTTSHLEMPAKFCRALQLLQSDIDSTTRGYIGKLGCIWLSSQSCPDLCWLQMGKFNPSILFKLLRAGATWYMVVKTLKILRSDPCLP